MPKIVFLGTGASGGTPGQGKSKRLESSFLIAGAPSILIDVTRNFPKQSSLIERIDCVLITHAHKDAMGGIAKLRAWWSENRQEDQPIPAFAHRRTIKVVQTSYKNLDHCDLRAASDEKTFNVGSWKITPIQVPHAFLERKHPTFAYKLQHSRFILVYASDLSDLTDKFRDYCEGISMLIVDGAMWRSQIFTHLTVQKALPQLCKWKIRKILLTQIGKTAPRHEELKRKVRRICSRACPAYDGMTIKL